MKKLLILVLVLAMASMASAALTYEIRSGSTTGSSVDTATLAPSTTYYLAVAGIAATDAGDYELYKDSGTQGVLSLPAVFSAAGDLGSNVDTPYGFYAVGAAGSQVQPSDGDWWSWTLTTGSGDGAFAHSLMSTGGTPVEVLSITGVPEPMTIALLGLGGLALIRRRK